MRGFVGWEGLVRGSVGWEGLVRGFVGWAGPVRGFVGWAGVGRRQLGTPTARLTSTRADAPDWTRVIDSVHTALSARYGI